MERSSPSGLCRFPALSTRQSKKVRISGAAVICTAVALGGVVGLVVCGSYDYVRDQWSQASSDSELRKLVEEREELVRQRASLQTELERLKVASANELAFRHDMKKKMDDLFAVVESSTGLGFLKGDRTLGTTAAGSRQTRRDGADRLRQLNKNLGGSEIECRRDTKGKVICTSSARKQNVSLDDVKAALSPAVITADEGTWSGGDNELVSRLDRYSTVLRSLPIGWPAIGEMTSGFGYRVSPFSGRGSLHEGLDVSLKPGSRVRVTGGGTVVRAERDGAYGLVVDVEHLDGVVSRYAHLSRSMVAVGDTVERGQVIALSGSSGRSTGPHLHYEVRVNGRPRNPATFVALARKLQRFIS